MIKYLPSHEYVRVADDNTAYIGITPFAAKQLGNVVYIDMPEEGDELTQNEEFGAIESVKAASDLFSPVSGMVIETNDNLEDNPKLVSDDPMTNWIIKVKLHDLDEIDNLLTQEQYDELCSKEKH